MGTFQMVRRALWFGLALAFLTATVTGIFLSTRDVMEIGGSCASGGPYVVANPCPKGVGLFVGAGIPAWFVGAIAVVVLGGRLPGEYGSLALLAWPGLFLTLGWNFLEFGLDPPGPAASGVDVGWLVCAVLFVAMGGLPLVGMVKGARPVLWPPDAAARPEADGPAPTARAQAQRQARRLAAKVPARRRTPPSDASPPPTRPPAPTVADAAPAPARPGPPWDDDDDDGWTDPPAGTLSAELERLAGMHASGYLDDDEFDRAKAIALARAEQERHP